MPASEHQEQAALVQWFRAAHREEAACLFAIPNGGARNAVTGRKLKEEGVLPGVPDLFLAIARGDWHGLFIEMKTLRGKASKAQLEMLARLELRGYRVKICRGFEEGRMAIENYLACGRAELDDCPLA